MSNKDKPHNPIELGEPYPNYRVLGIRSLERKDDPIAGTFAHVYISGISEASIYMDDLGRYEPELQEEYQGLLGRLKEIVEVKFGIEMAKAVEKLKEMKDE